MIFLIALSDDWMVIFGRGWLTSSLGADSEDLGLPAQSLGYQLTK